MAAPSMMFKITRDDVNRLLQASQDFNNEFCRAKKQAAEKSMAFKESTFPPIPERVVSTSDTDSVTAMEEESMPQSHLNLLYVSAKSCKNFLIKNFVKELDARNLQDSEIQTCLLIFLDIDTKQKYRSAFQCLSINEDGDLSTKASFVSSLDKNGIHSLFRCFLLSICLCVQEYEKSFTSIDPENPETKGGRSRSHPNSKELFNSFTSTSKFPIDVDGLAGCATNHLYESIMKRRKSSKASFHDFDSWCKKDGFAIFPWLKLINSKKWTKIVSGNASAENSPYSYLYQSSSNGKIISASPKPENRNLCISSDEGDSVLPYFPPERYKERSQSHRRTLVTFDFTESGLEQERGSMPLCIKITEENLVLLKAFVEGTQLSWRTPTEFTKFLLSHSRTIIVDGRQVSIMNNSTYEKCIQEKILTESANNLTEREIKNFSRHFANFFACYENAHDYLPDKHVEVTELCIGFSLFCSGNKSSKLLSGFELLEESGYVSKTLLINYLRAYLTILVGISFLSEDPEITKGLCVMRRKAMLDALLSGSKWTLNHFLKDMNFYGDRNRNEKIAFDSFAYWYTNGGFNVAPWLELLDLSKIFSLLPDSKTLSTISKQQTPNSIFRGNRYDSTSRRRKLAHDSTKTYATQALYTFPLAKNRSLVVLKEDANYVRNVVENLGLMSLSPDDLWKYLCDGAKHRLQIPMESWNQRIKSGLEKNCEVDQHTFVRCMEDVMALRIQWSSSNAARETLQNFFQSFDFNQIGRVPLNQLMGGLTLLCGGKKSTKLAFSFGLFDHRKDSESKIQHPSLVIDELFLFLRSFLTVMFSCCRQSLDLSGDAVCRYITDTSQMVAQDVMDFQWHTHGKNRVDFDEFGEWYNEGGFETAPWLELLDLNKWVHVESCDDSQYTFRQASATNPDFHKRARTSQLDNFCQSPPMHDSGNPSFFSVDEHGLLPMDSMDDMDFMLVQQNSHDKENEEYVTNENEALLSPPPSLRQDIHTSRNALKFHLVSDDPCGGCMISVSEKRVRKIKHILLESGLCNIHCEPVCKMILSKSSGNLITREEFNSALDSILLTSSMNTITFETKRVIQGLFANIYETFDREKNGHVIATELACGVTVLCKGKKSDKLEHSFEVLDSNRQGILSRKDVSNYLRSFVNVLLCLSTSASLGIDPAEDTILLMNGKSCQKDLTTIIKAAEGGSCWASRQAFEGCRKSKQDQDHINFDDFAEWYTKKGYSCIPWLELLDLRKWIPMD